MSSERPWKGKILIFKGDEESQSPEDPYLVELSKLFFNVKIIPALKFEFSNLESLQHKLASPQSYSGLILSSPRCVEAVGKCSLLPGWKNNKIFAVGSKTGALARNLGFHPLGESCGNAASLGEYIVKEHGCVDLPMLIPQGNLGLKTLSTLLPAGGVRVETVQVYETVPDPHLAQSIQECYLEHSCVDSIVFMSPSAVKSCLPLLSQHQQISSIKFVALGPTTAAALESFQVAPAGVADKPSPQDLAAVLTRIFS